jgi:hypothetical protein
MSELANHLWQSTLMTALVAAVCFALRKTVRGCVIGCGSRRRRSFSCRSQR